MLTGDNRAAAEKAAGKLDLDGFFSDLLPGDKVAVLKKLREDKFLTGMVGDGINDAPALSAGDLGIAVGSGSDIALECADAVLLRADLREVVRLIELSRAAFRIIRQNLFWAFFYNICGIPLAAGVFYIFGGPLMNPAFCAGTMALSSLTVVLNALRLLRFSGGKAVHCRK
jgi:Cu+-exporting ATPase